MRSEIEPGGLFLLQALLSFIGSAMCVGCLILIVFKICSASQTDGFVSEELSYSLRLLGIGESGGDFEDLGVANFGHFQDTAFEAFEGGLPGTQIEFCGGPFKKSVAGGDQFIVRRDSK